MIVFVAGMPRSGSTFTFNIARELLETRGSLQQISCDSVVFALQNTQLADHLVLKGHNADDSTIKLAKFGALKTICSVRRPEDSVASWMDTFGFSLDDAMAAFKQWIVMYRQLRDYALIVPYETIEHTPFAAARKIANYLFPGVSEEEIEKISQRYTKEKVLELCSNIDNQNCDIQDIGFSYYDKKSFFHRRHVTLLHEVNASARLTEDQIASIKQSMAPYCDEQGNIT